MNGKSKMLMLIQREVWENRSLWIAPLVIAGLILFAAAFGGIHVGTGDDLSFGRSDERPMPSGIDLTRERLEGIYAMSIGGFTIVQLFVLGIVVFFYLLDSLLTERKDRSILFWKSMPISDAQVVSSKLLTALVLAPIYVLLVSALTQLVFGVVWSLREEAIPTRLLMPWDARVWLEVQVAFAAFVPAVVVWYLPLAGYLMLVSVWARKNAFLWAVLPPAGIMLIESLVTHTGVFGRFLGHRLIGVFEIMDFDKANSSGEVPLLGSFLEHVGRVFVQPETWVGVVAAAAMMFAVVRIRRYRDDS